MALPLAMQWFPQCYAGGSMRRFIVPALWYSEVPTQVQQYMDCEWRTEDMTLATFLREANKDGKIQKHLKKRHAVAVLESSTEDALEPWAATAACRGEAMTASMYFSRYNDR